VARCAHGRDGGTIIQGFRTVRLLTGRFPVGALVVRDLATYQRRIDDWITVAKQLPPGDGLPAG
jgi:hypothetical protein